MVMKRITEEMKFVSGYPREDSMRAKAHKLLAHEFATTPMSKPASMTTPSREKMRLYKKGGHVKHEHESHEKHHRHEQAEHKRAKLHKREEAGLRKIHREIEAEKHLKHGGHAKHRRDGDEQGGHLTNEYFPKQMKLNVENFREATGMKHGGHAHKKCAKRTHGGSVYEHEMLGEHPSRKRPHINYESDMRGEVPERSAFSRKTVAHPRNVFDASHGQYKKKGGPVKKMAAGGVAKIRHGEATKRGLPISKKIARGY